MRGVKSKKSSTPKSIFSVSTATGRVVLPSHGVRTRWGYCLVQCFSTLLLRHVSCRVLSEESLVGVSVGMLLCGSALRGAPPRIRLPGGALRAVCGLLLVPVALWLIPIGSYVLSPRGVRPWRVVGEPQFHPTVVPCLPVPNQLL